MAAGLLTQWLFIPTPSIIDKTCPDQTGRVFLVTGGYTGIGFELCQILYSHNAVVYIAGRSQSKATIAISKIMETFPSSKGRLDFLFMDLCNPSTIKTGVETFMVREKRLDVLVNNAGIMLKGSNEPRFNEIQMETNCIGPCLLYNLLSSILTKTAATSPPGSVRVLWAGSIAIQVSAPQPGGMELDVEGKPKDMKDVLFSYGQTKVGNVFFAQYYAKKTAETGVVHACYNPGNLRSELQRHWSGIVIMLMKKLLFFPPVYGAYTQLWSALSPEFTLEQSGSYVYPWGRFGKIPAGLEMSIKESSEGGTGLASKFILWCEKQTESYR